jgi:hypothetical protein
VILVVTSLTPPLALCGAHLVNVVGRRKGKEEAQWREEVLFFASR